MANDRGVDAFLQVWNSLPPDYVPQWDFAYSEADGGLYAFPASETKKAQYRSRFTHEPVWYGGNDPNPNPITSQALATGQVPGAIRLGGQYGNETLDPSIAQDLAIWNKMVQAGNATQDEFSGLVANVFGNAYTLPAAFASGAMGVNAQGSLPVTAGTAAVRGTQNPTPSGAGSLLGTLASAVSGVPGGAQLGSLLGVLAQKILSGDGGQTMADGGGTDAQSWAQLLPELLKLIPGLLGTAGAGINLASLPETLDRLQKLYQQYQDRYGQQQHDAAGYQQLLDQYNQQQQDAYTTDQGNVAQNNAERREAYRQRAGETQYDRNRRIKAYEERQAQRDQAQARQDAIYQQRVGETAEDRARRIQDHERQVTQSQQNRDLAFATFQERRGETQQDRAQRLADHLAQVQEAAVDRANLARANQGRFGIGDRLSDPAQVSAGANALYQPQTNAEMDQVSRVQARDAALHGRVGGGGATARANAEAYATREGELRQRAMQNYLQSQQQALGAYNPLTGSYTPIAPDMPLTPNAPQPDLSPISPDLPLTPYEKDSLYREDYPQLPSTPDTPYYQATPYPKQPLRPAERPTPPPYVPGSNQGPQANQGQAYTQLSQQINELAKALLSTSGGGGGNSAQQGLLVRLLTKLFGGGGMNAQQAQDSGWYGQTGDNPYGTEGSDYGSDFPSYEGVQDYQDYLAQYDV